MIVAGGAVVPDPADIRDLAEFIEAMNGLRIAAGHPSFRVLAKAVGREIRPPQVLAHTTIRDLFQTRRRRLDLDLISATLRALGLDEPDVAAWRTACVRVQAQPRTADAATVLQQLPADLLTFTGREEPLTRIVADATAALGGPRPQTVVISAVEGMPGVGKTQLAVHVAHTLVRAGHFTDLQLFVNLHGFDPHQPPADPGAVLGMFLRQLGVPDRAVPDNMDERSAMYRDRMHDRAALVVLDNAADEEQVHHLIPASPTCMVLITSRRSMALAQTSTNLVLEGFSVEEGVQLLSRIAGQERVTADPESAARIVALCGGLPLALSIAAARLRSRPTWGLAEMVKRLEQDGVEAMAVGNRAVRPVLDLSYQGLSPSDRRMFALLGLHPGVDFSAEAAAALAGVEWAQARRVLETLQDENLLQERSQGRYSLHDLLREYAAGIAAGHPDAEGAVHRLLMFYLDSADRADRQVVQVTLPLDRELPDGCRPVDFDDREQAFRWFDAEYHNLLAVLPVAAARGHHAIASELPIMMGGYFSRRGSSGDWIAALRIAVDSATELGDVARLGGALNRLGGALTEGGRHADAAQALARAVELGSTLEDGRLWTAARTNLAVVLERLDDLEAAARLLQEVLPDQRRLGKRIGEGVVLENLGKVSLRMADYDAAIDYCEQALVIYEEVDSDLEFINALNIIGQAQRELGRLAAAEGSHRRALERSLLIRSGRSIGHSWHELALVLRAGGDDAGAVECLQQAMDAYSEVGDPRAADIARLIQPVANS